VLSLPVKNFENRLIFREVIDMSRVSGFLDSNCFFLSQTFRGMLLSALVFAMGVFRGGAAALPPAIEEIFALFKYSLSSFLPNHMYTICEE